ncbi:MAG: hypothetical protein LCI00_08350 [Chloroflexi bacterium]|nr:hypothetical protein [Chloroflexota bacterium]
MNNQNPFVYEFLTIYSQSDRSTGGTRGYDQKTYVETKLDTYLAPIIGDPKTKLVVLTGNAGDGKTAFIQRLESIARSNGAEFKWETDNGCLFIANGVTYETLYDGSQDFEGTNNDAVLAAFFQQFEGDKPPTGNFTKIIAINEGKLRDFLLRKSQYKWIGKQTHHYLEYESFHPHQSLVFVNLNLRSVVDIKADTESLFDLLLGRFLDLNSDLGFWEHCLPENCAFADRCYIRYNVDSFRDPLCGSEIRQRLKHLFLAVHFRKIRHITMRDLRSILSFILFNKATCEQLQVHIHSESPFIEKFYYNAAFNGAERDRIAQLLGEMDVATVSNPKLDSFIHFHAPDSTEIQELLIKGNLDNQADLVHLQYLFHNRPEGTTDVDVRRHKNAELYHAAMRRKLFFEGDEEKMRAAGLPTWKEMLPYRQFSRFLSVIEQGSDPDNSLRDEITLAISKSERIYNEIVGTENLCLRSVGAKQNQTKAFYGFPASQFQVVVKDIGSQNTYLEHLPNCIYYRRTSEQGEADQSVELEIPLDLFEILFRIKDGYVPTASEIRTFFLNLEMFKRRVTSRRSDRVFLTDDDTNLFEIKSDSELRIVMTKLGG